MLGPMSLDPELEKPELQASMMDKGGEVRDSTGDG